LGSWSNHPDLKDYSIIAFEKAVDTCISEEVDFIIIAGDLFDTSIPPIDVLRRAASKLRQLKENNIGVYVISGSHDYSPSGKTMLSVLEDSGLLVDVFKYEEIDGKIRLKFTEDKKTGVKFTGIMGRKGSLELSFYKRLDKSVEKEPGNKIFLFHAGIDDKKFVHMNDSMIVPVDELPKGFSYYASGHIHKQYFDPERRIVFPGELFPTSFDELENYNGGFVIVNMDDESFGIERKSVKLFDVVLMKIDVENKNPLVVEKEITGKIEKTDLDGKVLLLKLHGMLDGKVSDINFNYITAIAEQNGVIVIKKSLSAVTTKEFNETIVRTAQSTDQIERIIISEQKESLKLAGTDDIESLVMNVMKALDEEKMEDETNATFEARLKANAKKVLGL
ncbi:exonuclease SbcCD subunit D, partial [archaeon]|nr:exonuclease SbcCD subunit D [archaeon]